MFSKFLEGLSLIVGMCLLMDAVFGEDRHVKAAPKKPASGPTPPFRSRRKQMVYIAFGSSLLIYGMAAVMLRGM